VPKNIFLIGRQGHRGDEDQLTEMLAWLFERHEELVPGWIASLGLGSSMDGWQVETQRAIPGGFLDLVVYRPGEALVIVESKLGATTDFVQMAKYAGYAKTVTARRRALVLMTQRPHPWPEGVEAVAGDSVELVMCRWQRLAEYLAGSGLPLADDFVEMLEGEGLAMPTALTADHWRRWTEGNDVAETLMQFLREATPRLERLVPGHEKTADIVRSPVGLISRRFQFAGLSLALGFWPRRQRGEGEWAVLIAYVLNTTLPAEERAAAGQAAARKANHASVMMSGWSERFVQRGVEASTVLTADHFNDQLDQAVEYLADTIEYFRGLGYLPAAV